jgi:Leucine-rich repeat (LRR) protein
MTKSIDFLVWLVITLWFLLCSKVCAVYHESNVEAISPVRENIPLTEMQALHVLYNSTNGTGWIWKKDNAAYGYPWSFSEPIENPCTKPWQGITCAARETVNTEYHVKVIELENMGLYGSLPKSLNQFRFLTKLSCVSNNITGVLPDTIGEIQSLQILHLSSNNISGVLSDLLFDTNTGYQSLKLSKNLFYGTLPSSLAGLGNLTDLDISVNKFSGPLPAFLGNLTKLVSLKLSDNHFSGSIPGSLEKLTKLSSLDFGTNHFNGTLPNTFCASCYDLIFLRLNRNRFIGTIPSSIGIMHRLEVLDLRGNELSGALPENLESLTKLRTLWLNNNSFVGTIPEVVWSLSNLKDIDLGLNFITGTISSSVGNLKRLRSLALGNNSLISTIPDSLGGLNLLKVLLLYTNFLSGTIPSSLQYNQNLILLSLVENNLSGSLQVLTTLPQLTYIYVSKNRFTGPVPAFSSSSLRELYADHNLLTGTIPKFLTQSKDLSALSLASNIMRGHLPDFISSKKHRLKNLFLSNNCLSGPLPSSIGNLSGLVNLELDSNHFTGTIPASFENMRLLQNLFLNSNLFSGTIPSGFSQFSVLSVLQLQNNMFQGPMHPMFNASNQNLFTTLRIDNNQFTGTLPPEVFMLPHLMVLIADMNCFQGTLPEAVCGALYLETLVLNGLSSASSCRLKLLSGSSETYVLTQSVNGQVPVCVFSLPKISTLQLAGNKFTGSIANDLELSSSLTDLSLSHNFFTGSIPIIMQKKSWTNLDLSFNRLSGKLSEFLFDRSLNDTKASLSLENNRLSGKIPHSVIQIRNVSVLGSNLFSCNADKSNLPSYDKGQSSYQCASNSFNVQYFVWLGLSACVVVGLVLIFQCDFRNWRWWFNLGSFGDIIDILCSLCCCLVGFIVVIMLPFYCAVGVKYSTYSYEYAWVASAAFLSGSVPFGLEFVFFNSLLVLVCVLFLRVQQLSAESTQVVATVSHPVYSFVMSVSSTYGAICTFYVVINLLVVGAVNSAYIYAAINGSSMWQTSSQIALSFFKIGWNSVCAPYILHFFAVWVHRQTPEFVFSEKDFSALQIFVTLFNNIAIPCLVVASISSRCFYNCFVAAPPVTSDIYLLYCAIHRDVKCYKKDTITVTTTYNPPFVYNYQCSSSFITHYAPAFVSMCIVTTFVTPLSQMLLQYFHMRAAKNSRWYRLLDNMLPLLLKPLGETDANVDAIRRNILVGGNNELILGNRIVTTLVSYLGLVLTFGATFPPLAVAFLFAAVSVVFFTKYKVGNFLIKARELGRLHDVERIEKECREVGSLPILGSSMWVLIIGSSWFYTLFLFDTLGDAVGFTGAYWVLVVMPLLPFCLCLLYSRYTLVARSNAATCSMSHTIHSVGDNLNAAASAAAAAAAAAITSDGTEEFFNNDKMCIELVKLPGSGVDLADELRSPEPDVESAPVDGTETYNVIVLSQQQK